MGRRGLSGRALAAAIGVSNATVSAWLKGSKPHPSQASRLAEYFGITVAELLGGMAEAPSSFSELLRRVREEFYIPTEADLDGLSSSDREEIDRAMTEAIQEMERRRSEYLQRLLGAASEAGLRATVKGYENLRHPSPGSPRSKLNELKHQAALSQAPALPQQKPAPVRRAS